MRQLSDTKTATWIPIEQLRQICQPKDFAGKQKNVILDITYVTSP